MESHTDAVSPGDKVVLIDDLIATGGSTRLREPGLSLFTLVDFEGG